MPIFLTGIFSGNFQLSIGFPALGLKTLESVAKSGCVVKISSTNQNRTLKIDQTNFLSESTTLVPVNFIPPNGKNYAITIVVMILTTIYCENGLIMQMDLSRMVLFFHIVKPEEKRFVEVIVYQHTDTIMLLLKETFFIILKSVKLKLEN